MPPVLADPDVEELCITVLYVMLMTILQKVFSFAHSPRIKNHAITLSAIKLLSLSLSLSAITWSMIARSREQCLPPAAMHVRHSTDMTVPRFASLRFVTLRCVLTFRQERGLSLWLWPQPPTAYALWFYFPCFFYVCVRLEWLGLYRLSCF